MQYSVTCDADMHVMKAEAKDDQEALSKLKAMAKAHMETAHPDAKPMTEAEIEKMLTSSWKKG